MASNIPIICYDLPTISRFFRSCALARATQQTTHIEWETYRDSAVLNAVYTVFFWKEPPGTAEVRTATAEKLKKLTDEYHQDYLMTWVRKLYAEGPASAQQYVTQMTLMRDYARQAVQEVFASATEINNEVIGETSDAIRNLARIKLASQVGVAVIGAVTGVAFVGAAAAGGAGGAGMTILGLEAGATGTGFALAGTANSVTHSLIKTWEQGSGAKIAAVSMDAGKAVASEGGGTIAGKVLENSLAKSARADQIIRSAEGEIRKYSARLAQEGLKKKAARKATGIVAQRTARVEAETAAKAGFQRTAVNAARVGKVIPVVFAAWDVWDAVGDYRQTVDALR